MDLLATRLAQDGILVGWGEEGNRVPGGMTRRVMSDQWCVPLGGLSSVKFLRVAGAFPGVMRRKRREQIEDSAALLVTWKRDLDAPMRVVWSVCLDRGSPSRRRFSLGIPGQKAISLQVDLL